jgi:hypothetical protein
MRTENGGYCRDHLRALAQSVEVDAADESAISQRVRSPIDIVHPYHTISSICNAYIFLVAPP